MKYEEKNLPNPNKILKDLVQALDNAYISSWQFISWKDELDTARDYIEKLKNEV